MKNNRFITLGEILLRLTPPNHELIRRAASFEANYGGSEANIAVSLANLGVESAFFGVVPDNSIGKSAVRMLRSNNVDCSKMIMSTNDDCPTNRMGTYYLETGFGLRPSEVIYDRKHSAFSEYDFGRVDVKELLRGHTWLHLSGITPALSSGCRELIMSCLKAAKELGLTVSFDGNFRSKLWSWEEARDFCTECLPFVDVLFGIEPYHLRKDENDPSAGDFKDDIPYQPDLAQQDGVFRRFVERYPNIKCIARHVRYADSGSVNSLKAYLWHDGKTIESKLFKFEILDRVGGGDSFAAGLIYAMMNGFAPEDTVNFAVASSVIKHTISGDANIIDDVNTIRGIMDMSFDIKR